MEATEVTAACMAAWEAVWEAAWEVACMVEAMERRETRTILIALQMPTTSLHKRPFILSKA